ncbi:hypothetical protein GCM10009836_72920 [Pseudonocardia ailaonensis]|uniref:Uncharacterized protein n=1 Tax=Pseudonocardia ailaonensis TaxID=367279 RepID=A0ABN2NQ04_9PSEU
MRRRCLIRGRILAQGPIREWPTPDVVGHRVVHGGTRFADPVVVDDDVRQGLDELSVAEILPDVLAVACVDTAFHRTLPETVATCAVPREWRERNAIRPYGFHGLALLGAPHRSPSGPGDGG